MRDDGTTPTGDRCADNVPGPCRECGGGHEPAHVMADRRAALAMELAELDWNRDGR